MLPSVGEREECRSQRCHSIRPSIRSVLPPANASSRERRKSTLASPAHYNPLTPFFFIIHPPPPSPSPHPLSYPSNKTPASTTLSLARPRANRSITVMQGVTASFILRPWRWMRAGGSWTAGSRLCMCLWKLVVGGKWMGGEGGCCASQ